jgi:hypothetical protein
MKIVRLSCFMLLAAATAVAGPTTSALFDQMKIQFEKNFGVTLVADGEKYPVEATGGAVDARNAGGKNVDMVLYFLRKEFGKYPPEFVRLSGLERIVFCRDLKARGQRIAGVAVSGNKTIYMDSSTEVGDEAHRRRTLHHEFFHIIDYALRAGTDLKRHPAWEAANAPGAAYAGPVASKPEPNWALHPKPGFVSTYSMSSVAEDRAELFAGIMTNNLTLRLLLQKDRHLEAKATLLKTELKEFCPQIDDEFWTRTAKNF